MGVELKIHRSGREQEHPLVLAGIVVFATCLLGPLALTGCSGAKVTTQASNDLPRHKVRTIAIVPFSAMTTPQVREPGDQFMSAPESVKRSDISLGKSPETERPLRQTVTVPDYAAEKVTQLFWNRLRHRKEVTILSPSEVHEADIVKIEATPDDTWEAMGAAVAKQLNADAALIGRVLVYQERVGSRLGADPPAAVGFEVKVVAADGLVLWSGNYFERQRPMTEDLLGFLQRRGAFVTAEELARYGVDEVVEAFPFGSAGG